MNVVEKVSSETLASLMSATPERLVLHEQEKRYIPFVLPPHKAKEHMIAWRDKLFLVPIDMSTRFRSVKFQALFCPFYLFSVMAMTPRGIREFIDVPPDLPCCAPLKQREYSPKDKCYNMTDVLTRQNVSKLMPWNFGAAVTARMMKGGMKGLEASGGGNVYRMEALKPEKVWEEEVAPNIKRQLGSVDGEVTEFDDISYHIVYIPIYFTRYRH